MPRFVRDLLVIPLVVGAILAALTVVLDRVLSDRHELSYSVTGPTRLIDRARLDGSVKIEVNGLPADQLVLFEARIWNSGDLPIKNVPVSLVFQPDSDGFRIFSVHHSTNPPREFGSIVETQPDGFSRRYTYELFNPGDSDTVTALTNMTSTLSVFAKTESLNLKLVKSGDEPRSFQLAAAAAGVLGATGSALTSLLALRRQRERALQLRRVSGALRKAGEKSAERPMQEQLRDLDQVRQQLAAQLQELRAQHGMKSGGPPPQAIPDNVAGLSEVEDPEAWQEVTEALEAAEGDTDEEGRDRSR
jgi:hypothetical protein